MNILVYVAIFCLTMLFGYVGNKIQDHIDD